MQKSEVSDQIYCMYKNNSTAFWKKSFKKICKKVYYVDKIFFFKRKQLPFKNKSNFWYTSGTSGEIPNPNFSICIWCTN